MSVQYSINTGEQTTDFPHYWELCISSCHAATLLRADVQEQLRRAHDEIGFKYIRFHGLLNDDMNVVIPPVVPIGEPRISFFNIDRIFDFLMEIGMKPFVELSFMPEALASGTETCFHYRGNVTQPKEDAGWINLIRKLAEHLVNRYGLEEVRSWYFEVWNEPNLRNFFDGTMEDYFHLYEITARTLKDVDQKLRVGGPATSNNKWIPEFREFCRVNEVPVDFITTHQYPQDDPLASFGMNGPGVRGENLMESMKDVIANATPEQLMELLQKYFGNENQNPRDILKKMTLKAREEAGELPLIYTEWNVRHFDESYAAAGVCMTLAENAGLVEGYSYWCLSDIYEEMGLTGLPFSNEMGMVTVYGIRKPVYRLFEALHMAGDRKLAVKGESHPTAEVLALDGDDAVMVFAYNHDIEARNIQDEEMEILVSGRFRRVSKAVIDAGHTNPYAAWEAMGKPEYLSKDMVNAQEKASVLIWEELPLGDSEELILKFLSQKESVTIFRLEK